MWNILAFNEPCTEREKGFIDVLLMEKLRDWYYKTPRKKKSIYPISNTKNILITEKLHFLKNYPITLKWYWRQKKKHHEEWQRSGSFLEGGTNRGCPALKIYTTIAIKYTEHNHKTNIFKGKPKRKKKRYQIFYILCDVIRQKVYEVTASVIICEKFRVRRDFSKFPRSKTHWMVRF